MIQKIWEDHYRMKSAVDGIFALILHLQTKIKVKLKKFNLIYFYWINGLSNGVDRNKNDAAKEAEHWNYIYKEYCQSFNWNIRMELWMGIPTVIMPILTQFITKDERLNNLDAVAVCLRQFHRMGYIHNDLYWRTIGYLKVKGKIVVIALNLHSARVLREKMMLVG